MNEEAENIEGPEVNEPKHTEVELEQMEEGWIPPEREDQLDGKKFLSAEEYKERGKFFKKIDEKNKRIEALENSVNRMDEHNQRVAERDLKTQKEQYESTIEALKAEKVAALDDGDNKRVVEIDEQIRTHPEPKPLPESKGEHPAITKWKSDNAWYESNDFLADEADALATQYANRGIPIEEGLTRVTNHLKKKYPEEFENKNRQIPQSVDSGGTHKPNKSVSEKSLTEDELMVYHDFTDMGHLKDDAAKKKYIADVVSMRN